MPISFRSTFVVKGHTPLHLCVHQGLQPETLIVGINLFSLERSQFTFFSSKPRPFFHYKRNPIPSHKKNFRNPKETQKIPRSTGIVEFRRSSFRVVNSCLVRKKKVVRESFRESSYYLILQLEDQPISHEIAIINLGIQAFLLVFNTQPCQEINLKNR